MRPDSSPASLRNVRVALAAIFFANGAGLASWVPHIPSVQTTLALGPATLGLALLGMAAGALVAIPTAGALTARFGSRSVVRAAALLFFATLWLPVFAPSLASLVAALVLLGAGNGALDVSMNAQAAALERQWPHPIMSSFHGMWSVGGLFGAGVAAAALHFGVTSSVHIVAAALGYGAVCALALPHLLPRSLDAANDGPRLARPTGVVTALGLMALLALVSEGAIGDWSAVYLRHTLATSAGAAALGFASFQLMMAAGRFAGDTVVERFGNSRVVGVSGSVAAIGLAAALVIGHPVAAIVGCACVGLGLANVIPILFRAAAEIPGISAGHGIAAVSTAGYCGFLAGPPLIGLSAEVLTLPGALGLVVLCLAWIAWSAASVQPPGATRPCTPS